MKIITNHEIIENRIGWAKRVSTVGLGCLIIGFVINALSFDQPMYATPALGLLFIGMIAAVISSSLVNSWMREPRADQFLATTLKRFGNDYCLFNYTIGTANILLTPTRLYVIVVRNQDGNITVEGSKFKRRLGWRAIFRLFSADSIGAPINEAEKTIRKLYEMLGETISDDDLPEIAPMVVFSNKEAMVTVTDPTVPTLHDRELRDYLKKHDKDKQISATLRQQLVKLIGGAYQKQGS